MGINFILPIITGIVMMVVLGAKVTPSIVEQMKITKIENKTIANQDLIKEAIVRYIKTNLKTPESLDEIKQSGLLNDNHINNLFEGGYSFYIDVENNTLKIYTTIEDEGASRYFKNSLKFANAPVCEQVDNKFNCETFYLLDDEVFDILGGKNENSKYGYGDAKYMKENFVEEKLGIKKDEEDNFINFQVGDIDNVLKENEDGTYTVTEKELQSDGTWTDTGKITTIKKNNIGKETNVFIRDTYVPQQQWKYDGSKYGFRWITSVPFEKVVCKDVDPKSIGEEVFIINENSGLGEVIWVAPDSVNQIQDKISNDKISTNDICTTKVSNMYELFSIKEDYYYDPIDDEHKSKIMNVQKDIDSLDRWDTSNVTTMEKMFYLDDHLFVFAIDCIKGYTDEKDCSVYSSNPKINISNWDTSNVEDMNEMFKENKVFNQPLNNLVVNKVKKMGGMFYGANSFNQSLNNWDVSNVQDMGGMFEATNNYDENGNKISDAFNQPLNNWNVSNVKNMGSMFDGTSLFNQRLDNWDVSSVENMSSMFNNTASFNNGCGTNNINCPLTWNVGNVKNMVSMFYGTEIFNQNINSWNTSNVTNMRSMFDHANFFNNGCYYWDTSCSLNNWNVGNVKNMESMFAYTKIFNQNINSWNVSNVITMKEMFKHAYVFNQPLNNWNVSNVANMYSMFQWTQTFNQPLNNWNVSNVKNMGSMFFASKAFNRNISNWNVNNVISYSSFRSSSVLQTTYAPMKGGVRF